MFRRYMTLSREQKDFLLLLIDVLLVPVVGWGTSLLMSSQSPELISEGPYVLPLMMVGAGMLSYGLGLNRIKLKNFDRDAMARTAFLAAGLTVLAGVIMTVSPNGHGPASAIVFGLLYFGSYLLLRHLLLIALTALYRRSQIVSRVAILGAGHTGIKLSRELADRYDVMVYAFIDDKPALRGSHVNGISVHPLLAARKLRDLYNINRVIIADPDMPAARKAALSKQFGELGITVETLPDFAQLIDDSDLVSRLEPVHTGKLINRQELCDLMQTSSVAYRGKCVLVSGGGGSIGLELCRQILSCGPSKLIVLELSEIALYAAQSELRLLAEVYGTEVMGVLGSAADQILVQRLFEEQKIDAVMHAAAYKHVSIVEQNLRAGLRNNVLATQVLAKAARDAGVARFVLVSSDKAVRPGSVMGASKRLSELVIQDLAARSKETIFSIVRFGNVLGSSGSVVPLFEEQIQRGGPITLTDPRVTRYFMTIPEAARLVLLAGSFAAGGEVYVLDMGKPMLIIDLARRLIRARGYTVRDADNPEGDIEIVTTGLRPGEKLHEELMVRKGAGSTAHPKIIRVREDRLSELETAAMLRDLRDGIETGDERSILMALARAIPEYNPQNHDRNSLQMQVVELTQPGAHPAE